MNSRVTDRNDVLTLAHVEELSQHCLDSERFFMFINCPSTHVPYTTPRSSLTGRLNDILTRLYELHDTKRQQSKAFQPQELLMLLEMQVAGLEWADEQLGKLFEIIQHRQPLVVVCADHGEEFGDSGRYGHNHADASVTTVPLWCGLLDGTPQ